MKNTLLSLFLLLLTSIAWCHDKKSSLEFVENVSQWNENVLFKAGLPNGGSVYLENDGFTFSFLNATEFAKLHDLQFASREEQMAFSVPGHAWKLNLLNTSNSLAQGEKKKSYYHNYFLGQDQSKWADHVSVYEMVNYPNVYKGIDLKVYSKKNNFKYDFIIKPGNDPSVIKFNYNGLDGVSIEEGKLILKTSIGEFIESKPFAYQLVDGHLQQIMCIYTIVNNEIGYSFPKGYDTSIDLVIDPELIAATLSGTTGSQSNYGHSAAFDLEGNIFTGCVASGSGYPTTTGAFDQTYGGGVWDIGISKLNPGGSDLYWATFLGGQNADYPHSLITNNAGELYVYGSSASGDYPITDSAFQSEHSDGTDFSYDIIISHLEFDGSGLIGSTFLGGTGNDGQNANAANYGDNYRGEIIIDYDDNPIIASGSQSSDFPILADAYQTENGGLQDAVIVKLNEQLSTLLVSTYFGGPGSEMAYGLRTSTDGSIIIGGSAGEDMYVTEGAYQEEFIGDPDAGEWGVELDGFIAKLNPEGTEVLASTYHGTDSKDQVFFLDLDFDENIFVYGQGGGDMPVTENVYENPNSGQFITKFSNDLSELMVSTVIGNGTGGTDFVPDAFLVDNCENIYISAYNASGALETTDDALFTNGGFYLAVYEENLTDIVFGTFYTENHVDGGTSRFDKNGIVYQGVCSGGGFNTTPDAWSTIQNTGWDIGVFKINFDASGVNASIAGSDFTGCAPFEIAFENYSVGEDFFWNFGNGTTSTEYEPTVTYTEPGVYDVSLIASDSLSCNIADTMDFQVIISTPQEFFPSFDFDFDCLAQQVDITNTTNLNFLEYVWDMGDGTIIESEDVTYQYDDPGEYTISLTAIDNGCNDQEEISEDISVLPSVEALIESNGTLEACQDLNVDFTNLSTNATSINWNFGDNTYSSEDNPDHLFIGPNEYEIILTANNPNSCNGTHSDTVTVIVSGNDEIESLFNLELDCGVYTVQGINESTGSFLTFEWNMGDGTILTDQHIIHNYAATGEYTVELTVSDDLCGLIDTSDLEIEVVDSDDCNTVLIMPNVFSPNGDDYNSNFLPVLAANVVAPNLKVFNRWGILIFESTNLNQGWNGKFNSNHCSEGCYFWVISYEDVHGEEYEQSGTITLIH